MTGPRTRALAEVRITIGVRRYHAATGQFTTVREPQQYTGVLPDMLRDRYPACQCPRCLAQKGEANP